MKKSIKSALLSALVLPGAGHFFLQKKLAGGVLAGISCLALISLISTALEKAREIADQIVNSGVAVSTQEIFELAQVSANSSGLHEMNLATTVLFACWVVGIIDAYRVGRKLES